MVSLTLKHVEMSYAACVVAISSLYMFKVLLIGPENVAASEGPYRLKKSFLTGPEIVVAV